jgi:hypothetical protein
MKPFKDCYPTFFKTAMVTGGLGAFVCLFLFGSIAAIALFLLCIAVSSLAAGIYSAVLNAQDEKGGG